MRTRTSPWDYKRNEQPAPYNDTCPICGHACYGSWLPDGKRLYTCPQCINLEAAAAVADELDYADIAEKERDQRLEVEAARYGG